MSDSKPAFGNLKTGEVMLAPWRGTKDGDRFFNECPEGWVPGVIGPASNSSPEFHPGDHTQKPVSGKWIVPLG